MIHSFKTPQFNLLKRTLDAFSNTSNFGHTRNISNFLNNFRFFYRYHHMLFRVSIQLQQAHGAIGFCSSDFYLSISAALSFRPAVYNSYLCMHFTCLTTKSSQLDRWKFRCDSDGSALLYLRLSILFQLEQMNFAWWWQISLHFIDTKTYYFNSWQANRLCMFVGPFSAGWLGCIHFAWFFLRCLTLFDTSQMWIIAIHSHQHSHSMNTKTDFRLNLIFFLLLPNG